MRDLVCLRRLSVLAPALICFVSAMEGAHAAQDGRVIAERATIHQDAAAESPVIGEAARGALLRMSDAPRGGWYRTVVPGTRTIGWVNAYDVRTGNAPIQAASRPLPRADRSYEDPSPGSSAEASVTSARSGQNVYVYGFGYYQYMGGLDLTGVGGLAAESLSNFSFGGELGYWFTPDWAFGMNISWFSVNQTTTGYNAKATMFTPTLIKELTQQGRFSLDLGLGLVFATGSTIGATINNVQFKTEPFTAMGLLVRGSAKYKFTPKMGGQADLGYRYLTKAGLALSSTTFVDVNLSALYAGFGLFFEF